MDDPLRSSRTSAYTAVSTDTMNRVCVCVRVCALAEVVLEVCV